MSLDAVPQEAQVLVHVRHEFDGVDLVTCDIGDHNLHIEDCDLLEGKELVR
jgi:hypothetical protein